MEGSSTGGWGSYSKL